MQLTLEELRDAAIVYKGMLDAGYDVENIDLDNMKIEFGYLTNGFLVNFVIDSKPIKLFIEHIF